MKIFEAVKRKAMWEVTFGLVLLAVLVLSLLPPSPYAPSTGWDKTNHVLAFSVLAYLGCKVYPNRVMVLLIGLLVYGGLIEILQSYTPHRLGDWYDMLADGLGFPIGWLAHQWHKSI